VICYLCISDSFCDVDLGACERADELGIPNGIQLLRNGPARTSRDFGRRELLYLAAGLTKIKEKLFWRNQTLLMRINGRMLVMTKLIYGKCFGFLGLESG
jgi:hypothetical protein